ncbi:MULTISPECIES: class I fructose-bisphosphate aldolase [Xenorhabdus]|uniref:class I fructose-bisphosphate aldolase n=1 Tax=Xenorhabdus TaxID=626 RepID=UPI000646D127|nr:MULTISPECIES: hypothetical protein [Xenorhabdus]MBC8946311.1 autoinducer-2 aldolase LsrF [Xenorhabdus indica]MBC8954656.1 autoinducer-2 aldolase LsrF [Xenorhabdus sp. PB62.4]
MNTGITHRWSKFVNKKNGRSLIIPIDHGLTSGPMAGINNFSAVESWINSSHIDGIVVHPGFLYHLVKHNLLLGTAVCLQINGNSHLAQDASFKPLLSNADLAMQLGADAISLDLPFSQHNTAQNLIQLGQVMQHTIPRGIPVLVMFSLIESDLSDKEYVTRHRKYIRTFSEMGVTALKLRKPARSELLFEITDGLTQDINLLFAGGERSSDDEIVDFTSVIMAAKAQGLCIGRNVFQSENPAQLLNRLQQVLSTQEAYSLNGVF